MVRLCCLVNTVGTGLVVAFVAQWQGGRQKRALGMRFMPMRGVICLVQQEALAMLSEPSTIW